MNYAYRSPGVYREDVFVRPAVALPTGVPGFVGFGQTVGVRPALLNRAEDLTTQFTAAAGVDGYLADAVVGFFANGGERCYVVGADAAGDRERALKHGLVQLAPLTELDLVAVPDAMKLKRDEALRVQKAVLAHCRQHGNRFAILDAGVGKDAPAGKNPLQEAVAALQAWRKDLTASADDPANAALYYPWVKIQVANASSGRAVPPCGHVAGIYARSDAGVGVHKAPANEELRGVLDLEFPVDVTMQEGLNPEGINCLRAFPGRGLRVWGARTLSADANWRYINVRRLFLTLTRWIDRNLAWAAFEQNTPRLWNRIARDLNAYLDKLWQAGALKGASVSAAYYVKCDAETNPANEREQGRVTTEIGLAAALPAEFIVVRIIHRPSGTELSP